MWPILTSAWALAKKDTLNWWRNPLALVSGFLAPLVMLIISTVVFGFSGDSWPIGLVTESHGPASQRFLEILMTSRSNITPYFNVVETEPDRAFALARQGRLFMVIKVPKEFDAQVTAGGPATVETYQYNVNSDISKNTRLRLDHVVQQFTREVASGLAPVRVEHVTRLPKDVWRRTFIAGGVFVFALMVCGMLYTSTAVASEWQNSTIKELLLSSAPRAAAVIGKLMAGIFATMVTSTVIFLLGYFLMDLRPGPRPMALLGLSLLIALGSAAIGGFLGVWTRNIRVVHPLSIVLNIGFFFASGGFTSVATMPWFSRAAAPYIPQSWAFETVQAMLWGLPAPGLTTTIIVFVAMALAGALLMGARLTRAPGRW